MRLFVAVRPPADVVDALAALKRPHIPGGRWTTPEQWHVTLRFFGEVDDVDRIERALALAPLPVATASMSMGPYVKRLGHLLWVPVAGLDDLASAVVEATRTVG